ncbi:hypothetical protein FD755_024096 [Muntiacus reevesi]|uniref:Uncharacterized protein n=1 Tax=Muntiacus reevesi TaxID=9886 RepID=A0A5N3VYK9_MUNRE|nr:hypothetical protein FD755_024096 [Muntiacus reevesi]
MESETRPEEDGTSPGSWILVVSPGLNEGGALGPSSPVGAGEAMQAPGGVPGEEATLFWVEAVEEVAALLEGEVAGIGQEVQLLMLDVMEEVEVVVYQEQQQVSLEEQGQEHLRPRTPSDQPALEALAAVQLELEPVNKKAQRTHARLKHNNYQRRTLHLEYRNAIIQGICGFWVEVFTNHPQRSRMMTNQDIPLMSTFTLYFQRNRYFPNEVVVKEYLIILSLSFSHTPFPAGYQASCSTPIQWHQGFECKACCCRHHNSNINFFNWLSDNNFTGSDRIAEIIIKDLWPNPLKLPPPDFEKLNDGVSPFT